MHTLVELPLPDIDARHLPDRNAARKKRLEPGGTPAGRHDCRTLYNRPSLLDEVQQQIGWIADTRLDESARSVWYDLSRYRARVIGYEGDLRGVRGERRDLAHEPVTC